MCLVKCNKCSWVHFEVSKNYITEFCKKYDLDKDTTYMDRYMKCFRCGNHYKNFEETKEAPMGINVQPILFRDESPEDPLPSPFTGI